VVHGDAGRRGENVRVAGSVLRFFTDDWQLRSQLGRTRGLQRSVKAVLRIIGDGPTIMPSKGWFVLL